MDCLALTNQHTQGPKARGRQDEIQREKQRKKLRLTGFLFFSQIIHIYGANVMVNFTLAPLPKCTDLCLAYSITYGQLFCHATEMTEHIEILRRKEGWK